MKAYADTNTPFDPNSEEPVVPQDTQSSDVSKPSGLRRAWDAWTSKPENNAAMLQFGLNMLQPRAPGQSALGQFASSIGAGAEASGRETALQTAEQKSEEELALKQRGAASKEQETGAYSKYMGAQAENVGAKKGGVSGRIATQRSFNTWLAKPPDPLSASLGQTGDPILEAIQKQFPEVKTKGDLLSNPKALGAARRLFETNLSEPDEDTGLLSTPQAAPAAAPAAQYKEGDIVRNPTTGARMQLRGGQWIKL